MREIAICDQSPIIGQTNLFIYFEGGELCGCIWEYPYHLSAIAFV